MMVSDVDVLGAGAHLGASDEFNCAAVVFEHGRVYFGLGGRHHHSSFGDLVDHAHERNCLT